MNSFCKILFVAFIFNLAWGFNLLAGDVEDNIQKMANELELKYPGKIKVKIAILQFRTSDNQLTRFNQFIQDQLFNIYKDSKRFEVIDQVSVNMLLESSNWNLDNSSSFEKYNDLSEQLFRNVGVIPDAFIYGSIEDSPESITITGYIVPNGIKSLSIESIVKFSSCELTNQLLGKQGNLHSGIVNANNINPIFSPNFLSPFFVTSPYYKKEENFCFSIQDNC